MLTFLIAFISLYSAIHTLVYLRVKVLFPDRFCAQVPLILFFVLMIAAPIIAFALDRSNHDTAARIAAWIGLNWMGFVFLLFAGSVLLVLFDSLARLVSFASPYHISPLSGQGPALILVGVALFLCVYGFYEARSLRIERVTIRTDKVTKHDNPLKIALIADVHLGLMAREKRLKKIVAAIKNENPHIVVSVGDFIDGSIDVENLAGILAEIDAPLGKYAVTGNHEFYHRLPTALEFMEKSGFTMLRDEVKTVQGFINIIGVDDPSAGNRTDEASLLSSNENGLFTILLKHRPSVTDDSLGLFDLQLSGHTHGGQIWPFNYLVGLIYPYQDGLYHLDKNSKIYTSRGAGTWGPQIRILAPPEIAIITLEHTR